MADNQADSHDNQTFLMRAQLPELEEIAPEIDSYEKLWDFSLNKSDSFWGTLANKRLQWFQGFHQVCNHDNFNCEDFHLKWFIGGKLNVSVNCVDRHYVKNPNKTALIWEKDEPGTQEYVSYGELYAMMNRVANMLKSFGIRKGDCVAIYMPNSPFAVASMLACTRIGALHSVVFAGFSAEALASRINDAKCRVVLTANQGVRGGKTIELKQTVSIALAKCSCVEHVFVMNRTQKFFETDEKFLNFDEEILKHSTECEPEVLDADDGLFMLYTSGSTGKPKGVIHTQAGYILNASLTQQLIFEYDANDIFGCVADIGWITGHTYVVYGPLSNGGTTVLFESTPTYPDPGRYWETVQRLRITQFYTAPTAIRLLLRYSNEYVTKYDKSSLKIIGSVGEPLNHEAWHWYNEVVGNKCLKITDTWWQTETGAICIAPTPCLSGAIIKPAMPMRPFFGIDPVLVDEKGIELPKTNSTGRLCIRRPWPSMARTINGDHKRFIDTYLKPYPGYYFSGDGAQTDSEGFFQITGRVDDVINTSGHRIGTAELEDVLNSHEFVAESAVVSCPHDIKGEGIYAFITLKDSALQKEMEITTALQALVKREIAAFAVPDYFLLHPSLPKTRSGKIMRRILRLIAENRTHDLGDTSTLADPSCVEQIIDKHKTMFNLK